MVDGSGNARLAVEARGSIVAISGTLFADNLQPPLEGTRVAVPTVN